MKKEAFIHGGLRVTQNRLSWPFILFSGYPRYFSVEEVVEIVARDEEMDVHVQEEAGEEVTLTERITECVRKRLRKALRKPNSFNRPSKTNPQTVTWLEKLTA